MSLKKKLAGAAGSVAVLAGLAMGGVSASQPVTSVAQGECVRAAADGGTCRVQPKGFSLAGRGLHNEKDRGIRGRVTKTRGPAVAYGQCEVFACPPQP